MFKNLVPITKEAHKKLKVKPLSSFSFADGVNLASIMVHEFSRAAATYPIVFLEDQEKDQFLPTVLLGLEAGENLFVNDGKWDASYIPAIVRRYPFSLAKTTEEGRFTICIDEDSDLLNEKEGEEIFKKNGDAGEVMERVKKYLGELQAMEGFTNEFCSYMKEQNMFTPLNLKVRVKDEVKNISGAYVINEERLNTLSDEKFLEMREKKYLPVMYSHLASLAQIERLLRLKGEVSEEVERFPKDEVN